MSNSAMLNFQSCIQVEIGRTKEGRSIRMEESKKRRNEVLKEKERKYVKGV